MAELAHCGVRAQLAAPDPAASAPGLTVRVIDVGAQFYVPCAQPPNTRVGDDPCTLWLAPDRALQVGGAPPDGFASDVSDGLAVFEIAGPRAAELIAMGCTLPIPAAGRCAQSVFAGVHALIYPHGDSVRLHVERSLAAYVLTWLQQATTALQ